MVTPPMTLLSRVEALTGPDRATDSWLHAEAGLLPLVMVIPDYTASVSDALGYAKTVLGREEVPYIEAPTAPLSILIAVLRAKEGT